MARSSNPAETVQVTVSTPPLIRRYLSTLAKGTFGKNVTEAAERLISKATEGERPRPFAVELGAGPVAADTEVRECRNEGTK